MIQTIINPDLYQNTYRIPSARYKGYDYSSPGAYFVTICTYNFQHFFGEVVDGRMKLNRNGKIANICFNTISDHFNNTELDQFVIMPNHVHGIIIITDYERRDLINPDRDLINQVSTNDDSKTDKKWILMKKHGLSLGKIVRSYKARVTRKIRKSGCTHFKWQSRFWDRIIRNEKELHKIQEYIVNNPLYWSWGTHQPEYQNKFNLRTTNE